MISRIFILVFMLGITNLVQAQSKEARKYLEQASGYLQVGDYTSALQNYLKADELSPQNPGISYSIGICYYEINQGAAALPYLEVAQKGGVTDPMLSFYLGASLHLHHRFDE